MACRVVACNLILEYTLSVAVCARAFTAYGATFFGVAPESVLLRLGPLRLDVCALATVAVLGALLASGTRESARFNTGAAPAAWCRLCHVRHPSVCQAAQGERSVQKAAKRIKTARRRTVGYQECI